MNTLGESDTNSSIESLENEYKYPSWFNKKKHDFYREIYRRLKLLIAIHSESSAYYGKMDKYIFGPSIFITCLSGIASFLSTSEIIHSNLQNVFGISVGVLSSVSALLQSVGSAYRYSAKEESHRQAAEEYNKLSVKIKFEMVMPNDEKFVDKLEHDILEIQNKCNYFAPQFIIDKHKQILSNKLNQVEQQSIDNENTPLLDIECLQSYCDTQRKQSLRRHPPRSHQVHDYSPNNTQNLQFDKDSLYETNNDNVMDLEPTNSVHHV